MHASLRTNGIIFHLSCPYTSPQNGKAERILRTLNNSMQTLLIDASMPPKYWAEALAVATYLLNRSSSSSIRNAIPYFRLYNSYPTYDHLRVLDCLCYPNLQATSPHKLTPRSTAYVFLGYPPDHKRYRCLDLSTCRIIISQHVVFDESTFPFAHETHPPSTNSFDFLLRHDLGIAPLFTNHAASGSFAAAPSSLDVEQPPSVSGGSGTVTPLGPSTSSSPGGRGLMPRPVLRLHPLRAGRLPIHCQRQLLSQQQWHQLHLLLLVLARILRPQQQLLLAALVGSTTVDRLLRLPPSGHLRSAVVLYVTFPCRSSRATTLILFRHGLRMLHLESFQLLSPLDVR